MPAQIEGVDCDPLSLRRLGWQQGDLLSLQLPLRYLDIDAARSPMEHEAMHNLWLIADQDCDLAWRALLGSVPPFLVELRPVYVDNPPREWGIRSTKLLIEEHGQHLTADSPVIRVTPELLATATRVSTMSEDARRRLKTWMGLRYDRPAVPERFMALANTLKRELAQKRVRERADRARDVLAQFTSEDDGSVTYELIAVLAGDPSADDPRVVETREWLTAAALAVPRGLGTARLLDAYGDEAVSLAFVEHSYSLNLADVSWPRGGGGPRGAV